MQATGEQGAIVDAALQRQNLVVQAGAGTGKSTTLGMLATSIHQASRATARGLVLTYNKNASISIAQKLPPSWLGSTIHSLAYRAVAAGACDKVMGIPGGVLLGKLSKDHPTAEPWKIHVHLGVSGPESCVTRTDSTSKVSKQAIAACARATVKHWCNTPDHELQRWHVRVPAGVDRRKSPDLVDAIYRAATWFWMDVLSPLGVMRFEHDHYLKMWQVWMDLTGYQLPYEILCLDEAQDSNALSSHIFMAQSTQKVAVGDDCQTLYEWRGAVDSMAKLSSSGALVLNLSQSFRFGHEIAEEANEWLMNLNNPFLLRGSDGQPGEIGPFDRSLPRAVICRTNAGVIGEAMAALDRGHPFFIVGGSKDMINLVKAMKDLKECKKPSHQMVAAFKTWEDLKQYAESEMCDEADLKLVVSLLGRYSAGQIMTALLGAEKNRDQAHTVLSTAHKFKGDEHLNVMIGPDYKEPEPDSEGHVAIERPDAMAAYVAVTRARVRLDPGSLSYIRGLNRVAETRERWMATHGSLV